MHIQVHTDAHSLGHTRRVEAVVESKLGHFGDRITRVVVHLSDENSRHKFGANDKRCVMEARLAGLYPITVSHQGTFQSQAIEGAAAKLKKAIKRQLRRIDSISKRRTRERTALRTAEPLLNCDEEVREHEEFIMTLRPLLGCLGNHAWREMRIMEANGMSNSGKITFSDLLDEVVTRAWCQYADRPRWMKLDLWLTKLLDRVLEEWTSEVPPGRAALNSRRGEFFQRNGTQLDEQKWSLCLLGEDLSANADDDILGLESNVSETRLDAEELLYRIHMLLGDMPKAQRHAYVLKVLEGYAPTEIARLQNRPEIEVQADIEAARDQLRTRLHAGADSHATISHAVGTLAAVSADKSK